MMGLLQRVGLCAYGLVLCSSWPFLFLYYLCRSGTDGKYLSSFRPRMGLDLPKQLPEGRRRVWVHALSVGETLSSVPLVREMKRREPKLEIVFSTSTETGMSIARERLADLAECLFFMPHDFPWIALKILRRIRPSLFVLVETDLWPYLLWRLDKEAIATVLVNGRLSPTSYRRYSQFATLTKVLFERFDLVFTQTEADKARFAALGSLPGKTFSAGNLKAGFSNARVTPAEVDSIRSQLGIDSCRRVWVAGSTHPGEEEILLRVHREIAKKVPDPLLIIAPRNITRRSQIEVLCRTEGLSFGMRSRGDNAAGKQVFVLDTIGELARIYSVCDMAFIGGSMTPFGGHNPIEAIAQGKPVCWGPHLFNFREIESNLLKAECGAMVSSEQDLLAFLAMVLTDANARARLSAASDRATALFGNAAGRIAAELAAMIR